MGEHHPGLEVETTERLTKEQKEKILSLNAIEFLGLKREKFPILPHKLIQEKSVENSGQAKSAVSKLAKKLVEEGEGTSIDIVDNIKMLPHLLQEKLSVLQQ